MSQLMKLGKRELPMPPLEMKSNQALIDHISRSMVQPIDPPSQGLIFSRTKDDLAQDFASRHAKLRGDWEQVRRFTPGIVKCAVADKTGTLSVEKTAEPYLKAAPALLGYQPLAELMVKTDRAVHDSLNVTLRKLGEDIVTTTFNILEMLRRDQYVGGVRVIPGGGCQGFFYKWKMEDAVTGTRNGAAGKETDYRRSMKHRFEAHEVMDATYHPWNAWLPKPSQVDELLATVPECFRPYVRIITGREIYKAVFEREVYSETRTEVEPYPVTIRPSYRPDPFVVLGNFVLTGW